MAFLCGAWGAPALADEATPADDSRAPAVIAHDVRAEVPNLAYAYTAHGASAKSLGAMAYGLGVGAAGQKGILGGGLIVWGAPIARLTLVGDGQRNVFGTFSPSVAAVVRVLGEAEGGWSLGALGKFKVEGFGRRRGAGTPPSNAGELESEFETGLLLSYGRDGYHLDLNAIGGFGLGDDGEIDGEGRLRLGYDVTHALRVGVDGQARVRVNGPQPLPNGNLWDFACGPQLIVGSKSFFGSLTFGPATTGLLGDRVGWNVIASVGGTTL